MANLQLPFGVYALNAILLDPKRGPYTHTTEAGAKALAVAGVPAGVRCQGQDVILIIGGVASVYIWANGVADADLQPLTTGSISDSAPTHGSTNTVQSGGTADLIAAEASARATADTATLASAQAYTDNQRKSYFRSVSLSRGTSYANEMLLYFPNAGSITGLTSVNLSNILYKTSASGSYVAIATPIAVTAGMALYIKFDFTDTTNLNGNLSLTGQDS